MENCPICGHKVEAYHEVTFKEPFIHNSPFDGILIYGAYSSPKKTLCYEGNFLHFAFYDSQRNLVQHRLVQLSVENPVTKSPSEEYMEMSDNQDCEDDEPNDIDYMNEAYDRMFSNEEDELPF